MKPENFRVVIHSREGNVTIVISGESFEEAWDIHPIKARSLSTMLWRAADAADESMPKLG